MHRRIWSRVDKTLQIRRAYQGFNYVEDGDGTFGFVAESRQVNPANCQFAKVGNLGKLSCIKNCNQKNDGKPSQGTKHYGLAFPRGSPWRDIFSERLVQYEEEGTLQTLRSKWFTQPQCQDSRGMVANAKRTKGSPGQAYFSEHFLTVLK